MKYLKQLLCVALLMLFAVPMDAAGKESEEVDPSDIVMEHIKDSYDWHVTNIGNKAIVFHLPIIVKSSSGWHVFSSSKFTEEPDANGFRHGPYSLSIATKGDYAGKIVESFPLQEIVSPKGEQLSSPAHVEPVSIDISITKTVAVLFIDAILLLICILIPARWARRHKASDAAPGGFVGFMEMMISYVEDNIVKPGVGEGYEKYSPYLLTCFFFIFVCNIMGVVPFPPGGGNVTGNITVTFFLALCTFLITQFSGTKHYWKDIFWPDVPTWLKVPVPLIPFIEFIGIFTKPFALMIRLFANMMAGHAIAVALTCIIFLVVSDGIAMLAGMTLVSVLMSVFMMCLECLVCFIQAMVFTMLSATFIGLARAKGE